jgi:nitrite reductase/ring-hydroxylating ferredoxin subunit
VDKFVRVADVGDIPDETGVCVNVDGRKVALFHIGDSFYAIDDTCTHEEASLS